MEWSAVSGPAVSLHVNTVCRYCRVGEAATVELRVSVVLSQRNGPALSKRRAPVRLPWQGKAESCSWLKMHYERPCVTCTARDRPGLKVRGTSSVDRGSKRQSPDVAGSKQALGRQSRDGA